MKVLHKILVPPAIAALFLVLLGLVSYGVLHRQNEALEQLAGTRFAAYQSATDAAQDLSQVHSGVYRLITWLSSLKEDQINAQTRQQTVRLDDVKARMTAFAERASGSAEEGKLAALAIAELAKYRRSVLSAIDLSSGDTLTGATAMQLADKQFQATQKLFEELVRLEKRLAADSAQAAADAFRFAIGVLALLTVVALALSALIAVLLSRRIVQPLHTAIAAAARIADGDLSAELQTRGTDETAQLLRALADMTQRLRQLVGEVAGGANAVADTSNQIAQGNLDLSQRTEEQASTLEETASSIQQLTATVTQNADNARQASQLAVDASGVARKGGQVVRQVVTTMNEISTSSRRIADIVSVIDGIAFQTNILALNAAVEAARAGEQGRGFAVVAAEVRSLAQRSADAAKEIKTLIGESVGRVEAGTRLVDNAGNTMEEVVAAAKRVSDLIAEIAAASEEQSEGIRQVNTAVTQMDNVVQQNASLVEEAAAATESMKAQAAALLKTMDRFRLGAASAPRPVIASAADAPAPIRIRSGELPPPMAALLERAKAAKPAPSGEWRQF